MPRFDNIGMFWQDVPSQQRRGVKTNRARPPVPDTGWTLPTELPNLSAAKMLSIDTETFDPELIDNGPGWARHKGHIVGFSICTEDGFKRYFPIRHEDEPTVNLDPEATLRWAKDTLEDDRPKIGANLLYDVGWFAEEGINVRGKLYDVQFAEALLTEDQGVGLDILGNKYVGVGKESNLLYRWCSDYYGGKPDDKQRANIYRAPARLVGHYAEADAFLPFQVLKAQWPLLESQGLLNVFDLECRLIPLLIAMRFKGVRVDLDKAEQILAMLETEKDQHLQQLKDITGLTVDCWSSDSLGRAFKNLGLKYPLTAKGMPSFTAKFLERVEHPIGGIIRAFREKDKLANTFIKSYILESNIDGHIYCQFHPLRDSDGGTRSGRFSSSTPNLQNIPSRTNLGKQIRKIFVPDEGFGIWRRHDYSQIEYRFLAHFAVGQGSDHIREEYNADPTTDYHEAVRQLIKRISGIELGRKPTKNINFGLTYGMGKTKLIETLGLTRDKGEELFSAYHNGAPFVKATMDMAMRTAQSQGFVQTILGRRSRFDKWEPFDFTNGAIPLPYEKAVAIYGRVKRAGTHKALNRILQGSAADMIKVALVKCWEDGVFAETGVPSIMVHDEVNFSYDESKKVAFEEMQHILETAIPLRIPVLADGEQGPNWGDVA